MVPIEDLPEDYQPHASFYNKLVNIANGVDPTPRGERAMREQARRSIHDPELAKSQSSQGSEVEAKMRASGGFVENHVADDPARARESMMGESERIQSVEMHNITANPVNEEEGEVTGQI